ncbi:GPI ethanolamine phosphate transferase [Xylariales sp. PMI_506]|nr:GPI ethanolamine phosphate transferase [Xylariales sp. PMI_506]
MPSSLMSSMALLAANLLIPAAIYLFATGFFPYKPFLPGIANFEDLDYALPPAAPFDRLVFMVVDALRSDFVFAEGSGFDFTQDLIRNGNALPFTAHASSPTVTMPRIKAITTGSIPSFLDVILNIDEGDSSSTLAVQDTWLAQMKAKKTGKLLLYGDDTWLKLFPEMFDRADGTSSFFVSDFTEVDNNVTRHIADELARDDWNTMVLHYLGLDHIGHKAGPRSSNMLPKQREMDNIVRRIYQAMESYQHLQSTLLVLCGDHGMNDAGNHGASSAGETSPALVFISPKLKSISQPVQIPVPQADDFRYYSFVQQSDLAPTLGALLGFPVPKNNLGAFILDFLPLWADRHDREIILVRNAMQILEIVIAAFGSTSFSDVHEVVDCSELASSAEGLICRWHRLIKGLQSTEGDLNTESQRNREIYEWLQEAQSVMSSMASNYNMQSLIQGCIAAFVAALLALLVSISLVTGSTGALLFFSSSTLLYGVMMFASSYVEEEHHFWYWVTSAWFIYLSRKFRSRNLNIITVVGIAAVFLATRLMRGWNQTGQKFAGEPDITKMFLVPNPEWLWGLVFATYALLAIELVTTNSLLPTAVFTPCVIALVVAALQFKLAFTKEDAPELVVGYVAYINDLISGPSLVTRARVVFIGLIAASAYPLWLLTKGEAGTKGRRKGKILHQFYTLLALTQSRATNIPLFLCFRVMQVYLEHLGPSVVEITTSSLLLQYASFFALGGSNAISSVDLSSAYNGISGFNVVAVGVLTFISNWAGPVWWALATTLLLLQDQELIVGGIFQKHIALITLFTATSLSFVMVACTALRTHLFIWTVFSPKYLYTMAWSFGQHLAVNLGLGSLLFWLGQR